MLTSDFIKEYVAQAGFDLVGICSAVTPNGLSNFHHWLDAGYAGEMDYLEERRAAYSHPSHVMDGVRTIVMLGMKYASFESECLKTDSGKNGIGRISRYASSGIDYHDVVHKKLKACKRHFESLDGEAKFRGVVDTAPLLEREFAQLAGLGWQGKNTMLISKTDGSWFFLAALLTNLDLEVDQPFDSSHCGTCRACLDACPTDAFVEPFVLDGSKCISYFTIESQSLPAPEIREQIGDWLFGCDICQEVCPWNRKSGAYVQKKTELSEPNVERLPKDAMELFKMSDDEFRMKFRKSPFWRSKRRGILRNAAIVLGNSENSPESETALRLGLADFEPLVRAASAWGMGKQGTLTANSTLRTMLDEEKEPMVLAEIQDALDRCI